MKSKYPELAVDSVEKKSILYHLPLQNKQQQKKIDFQSKLFTNDKLFRFRMIGEVEFLDRLLP